MKRKRIRRIIRSNTMPIHKVDELIKKLETIKSDDEKTYEKDAELLFEEYGLYKKIDDYIGDKSNE